MPLPLNPSRALLNQDVVYAILQHLAIPDASWYDYDTVTRGAKSRDDAGERKGTLARCARVCRSFLFPAMSVLWRNLGSLDALCALEERYASRNAEVSRGGLRLFDSTLIVAVGLGCGCSGFVMVADAHPVLVLGAHGTQSLSVLDQRVIATTKSE